MEYVGFDLGKVNSQICLITEDGELVEKRLKTERETLAQFFGRRSEKVCVLIEASTESEWVARCLEELGCQVVVADPNFAPMYATRSKKVKTDRRDARALCEACRLGAYRAAHRISDEARATKNLLAVREQLVLTRSRYISFAKSLLRGEGLRLNSVDADRLSRKLEAMELPAVLRQTLTPLIEAMKTLDEQIKITDKELERLAADNETVKRLQTVPGVGVITAASFAAVIDNVERFETAKQVRMYLGLVPSENSSGERQQRGRLTKTGNRRLRYLLVEAAWSLLRSKKADTAKLQKWTQAIAGRRGKQIAVVALARKLAGILYAMWRDGTEFGIAGQENQLMTNDS
jgi:transposase